MPKASLFKIKYFYFIVILEKEVILLGKVLKKK